MHPLRSQIPLEKAIEAAKEFKHFLDVQPVGSLFNPCGKGEVLDTATYAHAAALLDQAIAQCLPGASSPVAVQILVSTVIDTTANHGSNGATQILRFLAEIAVKIADLSLQLSNQDDCAFKHGVLLELRLNSESKLDLPLELVNEEMDVLHQMIPSLVCEDTFSHVSITGNEVR